MLYQIKSKTGLVLGIHECEPKDVRKYLLTLPRQSAPHRALRIPVNDKIKTAIANTTENWSFLRGVLIGLSIPTPVYIYVVLHLFGVING